MFAPHAAGRTRVIAQKRTLDDVNDCCAQVLSGRLMARLVFEF
jgi:propanol-preferring alcohol dehydrogenase